VYAFAREVGVALLHRREGATERPFELEVDATAAVAGGPVEGELRGLPGPADITLLRIETCPAGRLATAMSATRVDPVAGRARFELAVPAQTPPDRVGRRCRLGFAVRARSPVAGRRRSQVVLPLEIEGGERTVHEAGQMFDRVIASFPARRFHIELADALLEGGGHIDGRVHLDDGRAARRIEVVARCQEIWRTNFRFRNHRQPPLWRGETLWSDAIALECDPDRHWHPFTFALPPGLPAAVEGRIICWRYEIEVRRRSGFGRVERAVATPLRFDVE
jgi:hypothetical protein